MTHPDTATVYYHQGTRTPAFVVVDGDSAPVVATAPNERYPDSDTPRDVDTALHTLGWTIAYHAPIVRQADGRGTVRIATYTPPKPDRYAVRAARVLYGRGDLTAIPAYVTVEGFIGQMPTPTMCALDSPLPGNRARALKTVDDALGVNGYVRVTDIDPTDGTFTVQPVPDPADDNPADWRDAPTLVRITDDAAIALNDTASALGIPADTLAAVWIRRAATDARERRSRFLADLADPDRIKGWSVSGYPFLDHLPDNPTADYY